MKNMATPEAQALQAITEYLTRRKHCFWRNNSGATRTASGGFIRFGTPGSPDICLIKNGFFIGLEVKAKAGTQSPDQKAFEASVKAAGGEYYIVHDIGEVQQIGL